jgi:GT2 family glycosyltransferase
VTALLPVKDYHEGYLRAAVDSMHQQSSGDWELLVIGERDNHDELTEFLAADLRDPRITLITSEGRRLAGALNTGMRAARTDFVAILLGDDLWTREAVRVLGDAIRDFPDADFFHTGRTIVDDDGRSISPVYSPTSDVTPASFESRSPVKHLMCWRRELALSFGGMDESLPPIGTDDFDFPWTMAEQGARFQPLPECCYVHRDHRSGYRLTTHLPLTECVRGLRRIMRKHGQGRLRTEMRLLQARRTYLKQCLYRSDLHRRVRGEADPGHGWRDTYA